jgi:hypothetical protein
MKRVHVALVLSAAPVKAITFADSAGPNFACHDTLMPMLQAEPNFPWLREFVIPVFFTILGAGLGFIVSEIKDDRRAKRAKSSFLRAVGMELDALATQLNASLREVRGSAERVATGNNGPKFAGVNRTGVFTSQVGKLRDVDDPLVIEVIHFYSDLGNLLQIFQIVGDLGDEFTKASSPSGEKDAARSRLSSGLQVLQEQHVGFLARLTPLRAKLPSA